jgi:hypothetical protein
LGGLGTLPSLPGLLGGLGTLPSLPGLLGGLGTLPSLPGLTGVTLHAAAGWLAVTTRVK